MLEKIGIDLADFILFCDNFNGEKIYGNRRSFLGNALLVKKYYDMGISHLLLLDTS